MVRVYAFTYLCPNWNLFCMLYTYPGYWQVYKAFEMSQSKASLEFAVECKSQPDRWSLLHYNNNMLKEVLTLHIIYQAVNTKM